MNSQKSIQRQEAPKKELIIKSEAEPIPGYGKYPEQRSVEEHITYGIINLDKPSGPTSHEIVAWVKNILNVKKAGHAGTLDPKVTGVLPIALDKATRILRYLQDNTKEYVCLMKLHKEVDKEALESVFKEFSGKIFQKPPLKSAVKRQLRVREIYYMDILETEGKNVLFRVGCESGTYIRKLCHDIGLVLGTGANMVQLRRTKSGSFDESSLVTLYDVKDACMFWKESGLAEPIKRVIQPVESAVKHLPKIVVKDSAVGALSHGAQLGIPGISALESTVKKGEDAAIFTLKNELVAVGTALMGVQDIINKEEGIAVKPKLVVMEPNIYPKMWKSRALIQKE